MGIVLVFYFYNLTSLGSNPNNNAHTIWNIFSIFYPVLADTSIYYIPSYLNFWFYLLSCEKMKKEVPSGIGTTLLSGDSEAIRRLLSTSSSSNSNWPSSSSAKKEQDYFLALGIKLPIFRGEDEKRAFFRHRFALLFAMGTHGRTRLFPVAIVNWIWGSYWWNNSGFVVLKSGRQNLVCPLGSY